MPTIISPGSNRLVITICTVLLVSTSCPFLLAQTEIRFAPGFGVQAAQSYVKEDINADDSFGAYNISVTPAYNISLQFEVRGNWLIYTSLNSVKPTIGYKYSNTGAHDLKQNSYGNCTSLSLGIQKKISTHKWLRINPTRKPFDRRVDLPNSMTSRYLLLFKLKIISGISHDWVANYPNTQSFRNRSTSLFFGFGLQFFDQAKDRFLLSFIYSQGAKEIVELDADYVNNGINYYGKIGSKGSFFSAQVSYPLRLITTLKRKKD